MNFDAKSWFRLIRVKFLYGVALVVARINFMPAEQFRTKLFVIGCGRSGTTILGKVLETHPDADYHFEPWHLWAAIDPRLDLTNFCVHADAHAIVDGSFSTGGARLRFERLFSKKLFSKKLFLVEKSPVNAMRIRYIENLAPGSYYINIVRDGVEVVDSIEKLSNKNSYSVALRENFNQWWGVDFCKWEYLKRDGKIHGYFPDEVDQLTGIRQMAAYEWLISIAEVEKNSARLGSRLIEISYRDLCEAPQKTLKRILSECGVVENNSWIENAIQLINNEKEKQKMEGEKLFLPVKMCAAFNELQKKYGFESYAYPLDR